MARTFGSTSLTSAPPSAEMCIRDSYIGVVSHPFFAVTGDDGTFTIKGLPPGTYTIEVVHEKYGTSDQDITVAPKDAKTLDFTVKG